MTLTARSEPEALSLWLDSPERPAARPALSGQLAVDLAVVGGGFTGLWAALLALEEQPDRSVVVVEGARLGWAASGRNGGFCAASLTHGIGNGLARWPEEMPALLRLGQENLDAIEQALSAHRIECGFERTGALDVAVADWQVEELREVHEQARRLGADSVLLDGEETRSLVSSPTYLGGVLDRTGTAMVDPARLVWGLAARGRAARRPGRRAARRSPRGGTRATRSCWRPPAAGSGRARSCWRPTSSPPSCAGPGRTSCRSGTTSSPPSRSRRTSWRPSAGRAVRAWETPGNQFHYYRLSSDNRLVWGGYDALYYFGSDLSAARARSPRTEQMLARHLVETFPQLEGVAISHTWGGAIDTCTRFSPFWGRAMGGRVAYVAGYTGLGVGSSRFGAQVCLDLLAGRDNERTAPVDGPAQAAAVPAGAAAVGRDPADPAQHRPGRRG